jgi:hypothetical protein
MRLEHSVRKDGAETKRLATPMNMQSSSEACSEEGQSKRWRLARRKTAERTGLGPKRL